MFNIHSTIDPTFWPHFIERVERHTGTKTAIDRALPFLHKTKRADRIEAS
jgi:hypothetical protein